MYTMIVALRSVQLPAGRYVEKRALLGLLRSMLSWEPVRGTLQGKQHALNIEHEARRDHSSSACSVELFLFTKS